MMSEPNHVIKKIYDRETKEYIQDYLKAYILSLPLLSAILKKMEEAFSRGLNDDPSSYHYSPLKMLPTHLCDVPTGAETGTFLAIDLGGTNLRFLNIYVIEGKLIPMSESFTVPKLVMTGTAEQLFGYIAECIEKGMCNLKLQNKEVEFLGFTFSFPVNQTALNSGTLIKWTKGYCASGVEGKDVVALLRTACKNRGLKIKDYVLINDTTGTLLCGAWVNSHTKIAVIVGTGTNACYLESLDNVKKWKTPTRHTRIIINTEWGAFGENGELNEIRTPIDIEIDETSLNPGKQIFEKLISGMYVGELARKLVLAVHKQRPIFSGQIPEAFTRYEGITANWLSRSCDIEKLKKKFQKHLGYELNDYEAGCLAEIFDIITRRSANLVGVGLSALLNRIDCPRGDIAADGSLVNRHPRYVSFLKTTISSLLPNRTFNINIANDGSGQGAALAACVASNTKDQERGYETA